MSVFRSAIQGDDGEVDAGYLGLYVVMLIVLGVIPFTCLLVLIRMFIVTDHPLDLVGLGTVVGAATAGFGAAAGGVGAFRAGDKPRAGTTTTVAMKTTDTTNAPLGPPGTQ